MGLRVYHSPRYTIDLDALLVKSNLSNALETIKTNAQKDFNDGVWFRFQEEIDLKTQGEYGGIRQVYRAGIGSPPQEIKKFQIINFDLGVGDPVFPHPIENKMTELIGKQELSWIVYPIETIIAEKIHALIDRGEFNSRSKDIFDLANFIPQSNSKNLIKSIEACFKYRNTPIPNNLIDSLNSIDLKLLKKGWASATSSLKNAPDIEVEFKKFLVELERKLND